MEDYKEKYEMALEGIQEILSSGQDSIKMPQLQLRLQGIFPELKESEDEKIRGAIIDHLKDNNLTEWAVWLENQSGKDKLIKELGKYKVKYTQEVLEKYINSMSNKDEERLRKTTIAFLKDFAEQGYENAVECIDWLEKQGEQKPTSDTRYEVKAGGSNSVVNGKPFDYENATITQKDFVPQQELKFKVGDWIIRSAEGFKHNTYLVKEAKDYYVCEELEGRRVTFTFNDVHKNFKLWDISDAKEGDVLFAENFGNIGGCVFLFNMIDNLEFGSESDMAVAIGHCCIDITESGNAIDFGIQGPDCVEIERVHPATKEQRDLLFAKMEEAGYQWDDEKKELKKIHVIDDGKAEMDYCFTKMMAGEKVSPVWSDKDERMYRMCVDAVEYYHTPEDESTIRDWLKSLKNRVQPQPKEWTVEDMSKVQRICKYLDEAKKYYADVTEVRECIDWLQSLKERNAWKPSKGQMHTFEQVYEWYNDNFAPSETLTSLYNDLKKL